MKSHEINGNSRILNGGTLVPYKAIFCGDIPLHRPYKNRAYFLVATSNESDPEMAIES
jgi:hypothetical protein